MSNPHNKEILASLAVDPLAMAEHITGKSYKDDDTTSSLVTLLHLQHNRNKRDLLEFMGDTRYGISAKETIAKLHKQDFITVMEHCFQNKDPYSSEPVTYTESLYVLCHKADGILIVIETHMGINCNKITVNFNWKRGNRDMYVDACSGHFIGDFDNDPDNLIWVGHFDGREGLFARLEQLRETGKFIAPWVEMPFMYLMTFVDERNKLDYKVLTTERFGQLPKWVRDITGEYKK